jgi:hypothetical protein
MVILFFLLHACSVDLLDIYVPPRGFASIQQEDIRRDIWSLQLAEQDVDDWLLQRASQLNVEIVLQDEETICFSRGEQEKGLVFWVNASSEYKNVAVAALLSLAKSTEQIDNPFRLIYCVGRPPKLCSGCTEIEIANVSGIDLVEKKGTWTSSSPGSTSFIDLNFELIQENVSKIAQQTTPHLPLNSLPKN